MQRRRVPLDQDSERRFGTQGCTRRRGCYDRGAEDRSIMPTWEARGRLIVADRVPKVMGIVNVTPDSFSDGGRAWAFDDALARAIRLVDEGADLIDIGGESSRPGAQPVPLEEEL